MAFNVKIIGADTRASTSEHGPANALWAVKAAAKLFTLSVFNSLADTVYLQVYDIATAADQTALLNGDLTPELVTPVFAGTSGGFNFSDGAIFHHGIFVGFSQEALVYNPFLGGDPVGLIHATYRLTA